ncbi:glycosyltransferase [Methylobacter sp. S3L5C]|uniref:glycosyltransferase n=1 Tax=Methylobacter sp. S3L5C TaxID=2839024 RepID=UPI001FAC12CD|nr:glycosyltransferase [Methylobacter sp. S3L5C]UOA09538.1 glycosyltransferase [Methylobacter sp. S3L5C]
MQINPANMASASCWYSENTPQVSIVILNFNKAHLTIDCLQSIWEYTSGYYYEIIVVDNGSQSDDFQVLSAFKGAYKLLRLDVNRYFGEGNNIGAELAKGEFLLFMNNDVIVTPGWLAPLMAAFNDYPDCGVAGPKFIYPNGLLQEAGALLDEEGGSIQIGKFQDPESPRFNHRREVDYVSAAAVLLRKKTFEKVLGFDFIYEPGYFEDVDLCLKIAQLELKTYYVSEACVVHHENATTADPKNGLRLNSLLAINREKFVQRWGNYLKTDQHSDIILDSTLIIEKGQPGKKPTAAVFTLCSIIPGGEVKYLLAATEALIQAGYQVWLVTPEKYSYLRITKIAAILGLNLQGLSITTLTMAEAMPRFDIFVAMGNEVTAPVKALGKRNFYCCQLPFPCTQDEINQQPNWMDDYEAFIVYSDFVKNHLIKQLVRYSIPSQVIHIINPPVDMQAFNLGIRRSGIISVGRFFTGGHCKQQDFLIRAFRKLYESGIRSELHLVGSIHPEPQHREYFLECQRLAQGLPVHFHVDASPSKLATLYASSFVYWHGVGFGVDATTEPEKCEPFGLSVVEAMSAGVIPLVVNNGGPAIIIQDNWNGYCYDTEDRLIELTQGIFLQPEPGLSEMRVRTRIRSEDFSKESFTECWQNLLQ